MNRKTRRTSNAWRPAGPSAADLLLCSIPMIDETSDTYESAMDWPEATYGATAKPMLDRGQNRQLSWTVEHILNGAPGIIELLVSQQAAWAVEYRCAETMHLGASTAPSTNSDNSPLQGTTRVSVDKSDVGDGTLYLWPGVVTVERCKLNTTGANWGSPYVEIGAGRWLVRGAPVKVEHESNSMLVFQADEGIKDGKVRIKVDSTGQDTRFEVYANPDRIELLHSPDTGALLGCWATALAMLPYQNAYNIEEDEDGVLRVSESQLGEALIERLRSSDSDFPLWNTRDEWDPMAAATLMLELPQHPPEGTEE